MTQAEYLEETLKVTTLPVKPYEYAGTNPEYILYNEITEKPVNYGDNQPLDRILWWQVHLFAPKQSDFRGTRKQMEQLLKTAGFRVTEIKTLFEKETKTIHVVIYCHMGEREE